MSGHPVQEEDRIAIPTILVVAVVSLLTFGVGVIWAVSIQRSENKTVVQWHKANGPDEAGKPEVGIVFQTPFNKSAYAEEKKAEKTEWLAHYGYSDKAKGVVHIPIDQAIQKYVQSAGAAK